MKYLKRFENVEDNSEILSDLEDILSDLKDEYFDIFIRERDFNYIVNKSLIRINIIQDKVGGLPNEFELSEINEYFERIFSYMKSNDFELRNIDAFDKSKIVKIPIDINQWDLDTKVLGINFYFNN